MNDLYINLTKKLEIFIYKTFKQFIPNIYVNKYYLPCSESSIQLIYLIGKPIKIEKNINPNEDDIKNLYNIYYKNLIKMYNENKKYYGHENRILSLN